MKEEEARTLVGALKSLFGLGYRHKRKKPDRDWLGEGKDSTEAIRTIDQFKPGQILLFADFRHLPPPPCFRDAKVSFLILIRIKGQVEFAPISG